jgi:hypothetical protein
MKLPRTLARAMPVLAVAAAAALPNAAAAQYMGGLYASDWKYSAILYAYLPKIDGSLNFATASGSPSLSVDVSTLLENLKFAVMGTFDVHNGRWGIFTDVLYMNVSGSASKTRDFSLGNVGIPAAVTADLDLDLKGVIWTVAGEYRLSTDRAWTVDLLAGARYFGMEPKLDWTFNGDIAGLPLPGRSGSREVRANTWDAIAGVKATYAFPQSPQWHVPFYADVGGGQSDLTWQIAGGIGYAFKWGDLIAMWRYLDYDFKSGEAIKDMSFNGPMLGIRFHW